MEADFWGFDGTPGLLSTSPWGFLRIEKMSETEEALNGNKPSCSLSLAQTKLPRMLPSQGESVNSSKSGYEIDILYRPWSEANVDESTQYDSNLLSLPLTMESKAKTMKFSGGPTLRLPESRFQLSHKAHKGWDSNVLDKRRHAYRRSVYFPFKHKRHAMYRRHGISKQRPDSDWSIFECVVLEEKRDNESDLETKLARLRV